jgi:predicted Rossmann fold nucleotide-binding protein DprA/Smf involved in DNA uptake
LHAARRTEETVLPQEESANYTRPASNDGNTVDWRCEPEYPQSLLQIYDPPVALYGRGDAPVRAVLVQLEAVGSVQRNLLVADGLTPTEKKIYELLSEEESRPVDARVETGGLNSSEVLATLFTLELKGIVRQLPGTPFNKALL